MTPRILCIVYVVLIAACKSNQGEQGISEHTKIISPVFTDEQLIADTIIYDVIIKNNDPDDGWQQECLKNLQYKKLIDNLFTAVYENKATAYDFFENSIIEADSMKKLERQKNFNRDLIGKIQFTEKWFYSKDMNYFQKEIISMVLGYETYDDSGALFGYKPAFKIYLTQANN
ncbi:MAG: hypothetical protein JXJ22_17490 [Bacteroidales bacterium]|nr:hypothetical protein [Bacteroidales bacterium]